MKIKKWLIYLRDKYDHKIDLETCTLLLLNGNISFSKNLGIINYKNNIAVISDDNLLIDIEGEHTYYNIYDFIEKYDIKTFRTLISKSQFN